MISHPLIDFISYISYIYILILGKVGFFQLCRVREVVNGYFPACIVYHSKQRAEPQGAITTQLPTSKQTFFIYLYIYIYIYLYIYIFIFLWIVLMLCLLDYIYITSILQPITLGDWTCPIVVGLQDVFERWSELCKSYCQLRCYRSNPISFPERYLVNITCIDYPLVDIFLLSYTNRRYHSYRLTKWRWLANRKL